MDRSLEFKGFEQQILDLMAACRTLAHSEIRLRESLRAESTRAEAAEANRAAAVREAAESRIGAAVATSAANKAILAVTTTQEQLADMKFQLNLKEFQCKALTEQNSELVNKIILLERELAQLKPLQSSHAILQQQYAELQGRVYYDSEEARREGTRLGLDFRRVEKCAEAGFDIRERAKLAATAHAREKLTSHTEQMHTQRELSKAEAEIIRLNAKITELEIRSSEGQCNDFDPMDIDPLVEVVTEVKAALEAEQDGAARLEEALTAALAGNESLASCLHSLDNTAEEMDQDFLQPYIYQSAPNNCAINSFLAE